MKKERRNEIIFWGVTAVAAASMALLAGCGTTGKAVTQSASGKNLNLDGYVMLGEIETANPETVTPQGKIIIGRVTYKSRKVGIPADQKVPTAGYFKATKTTSLFGTEEQIIEWDWTAGSEADAKKAEEALKAKQAETEKAFAAAAADKDERSKIKDQSNTSPAGGSAAKAETPEAAAK